MHHSFKLCMCLAHCSLAYHTARVPRSLRACLAHCARASLTARISPLTRVCTSYCCSNYMETPCLCQHILMNHYKCPCTLIKSYLNVSGGLAFQQGSLLPSASHASVTPFNFSLICIFALHQEQRAVNFSSTVLLLHAMQLFFLARSAGEVGLSG